MAKKQNKISNIFLVLAVCCMVVLVGCIGSKSSTKTEFTRNYDADGNLIGVDSLVIKKTKNTEVTRRYDADGNLIGVDSLVFERTKNTEITRRYDADGNFLGSSTATKTKK